jgi:protease I
MKHQTIITIDNERGLIMAKLQGKRIAMVVDNYAEEAELADTMHNLQNEGAAVSLIATSHGMVQTMNHDVEMADKFSVDMTINDADFSQFDALVLPGGAINSDHLRTNIKVRDAITMFMKAGKPLAAICHAPWSLISAGVTKGRKVTSFETLQDDARNAGAIWVDQAVVVDGNLITSRKPDDIRAFSNAIIDMLAA